MHTRHYFHTEQNTTHTSHLSSSKRITTIDHATTLVSTASADLQLDFNCILLHASYSGIKTRVILGSNNSGNTTDLDPYLEKKIHTLSYCRI